MTIQSAIEKAIEGGWEGLKKPTFSVAAHLSRRFGEKTAESIWRRSILLDPTFWQALGKVEHWWEKICTSCQRNASKGQTCNCFEDYEEMAEWLFHMHRMIDHLADGGSIESFIETL